MEVPCLVDAHGVQPTTTTVAHYPKQLAALDRTSVSVQELAVESSLTGETDVVHHTVVIHPLTAAACTLPRIRALVDEMLEARACWLQRFRKAWAQCARRQKDSEARACAP